MRTFASTQTTALAASLTVLAALAATLLPDRAQAAETYHTCKGFISSLPATISTQGTWCLNKDLSTATTSGNAITVMTNNVTIDCNHFKIGGLAAGAGTAAVGIGADSRLNLTVRNCNVRGFLRGVYLGGVGGGGHVVEGSRFDGNTHVGIYVSGDGSTVRRNLVLDTGGSLVVLAAVTGIWTNGDVDVLDNTVNGLFPTADASGNGGSWGIYTTVNSSGSLSGNRIRGLVAIGTGSGAFGIVNIGSGRISLRGNDIIANLSGSNGLSCSNSQGTAKDNIINGFTAGIINCSDSGGNVIK